MTLTVPPPLAHMILALLAALALAGCPGPGETAPADASAPDAHPPADAAPLGPDACQPLPERCNGRDESCDGMADEPWQDELGQACTVGTGACAATGTRVCAGDGAGTTCSATPATPAAEVCGNHIDDDCDGAVDEGCACDPGEVRPCGSDVGACATGTQTCGDDGQLGACEGAVGPTPETCNDVDDDCDGTIDEALVNACDTGAPGVCATGTSTCAAGAWSACEPDAAPAPETCNGLDDDCDGTVDEALVRGCGTDVGECVAGTQTCAAGAWGACTGATGPALEDCDGGDEDCDGVVDDGCPAPARLLYPWNGFTTGSALAAATTAQRRPLRPSFRWFAVAGANAYDLTVDDSCDPRDFRACALPSPEATMHLTTTRATLTADLPVSQVAPVGRRYFWRVRACAGPQCGPWSEVRYLDVGRLPDDFDGDGFSDVLAGAPRADGPGGTDSGRAYVYRGGAGAVLDATPELTLDGEAADDLFGSAVAAVGDLDGDGFADFAVGAPFHETSAGALNRGRVYVYRGGASLDALPDLVLDGAAAADQLGAAVAGAGDADGDGLADVLVGAPGEDGERRDEGRAHLYFGAETLDLATLASTALLGGARADALGWSLAGAGDLDGDGMADLVVGAPYHDDGGLDAGAAFVYRGDRARPATRAPLARLDGVEPDAAFGWSVAAAGDTNGDGFADLVVGACRTDVERPNAGAAYVYLGGLAFDTVADGVLTGDHRHDDFFAWSVAGVGDVNGDGFDDVLAGEPYDDQLGPFNGAAYLFLGKAGTSFDTTADMTWLHQFSYAHWGSTVAGVGDLNADGFADFAVAASHNDEELMVPGSADVFLGANPLRSDAALQLRGENAYDHFAGALARALPWLPIRKVRA